MYGPTRAKRGEKSGDLNSRKLHKRFLELRSCDLLGGRLALMTTSDNRRAHCSQTGINVQYNLTRAVTLSPLLSVQNLDTM